MKKYLFLTVMLVVALALTLTACAGDDTTAAETTAAPASSEGTTTVAETENPLLVTAYDTPESFVSLPALKDVTIPNADIKKLVDADVTELLKELGKTAFVTLSEGTAAVKGDAVNIHYTGRAKDPSVTLSETTLQGMTNASDKEGYDLVLGSGAFIPGFEDQLIGAKKGDTIAVDVTFPTGYSQELSDVAVIFDVTVNEVKRATVDDKNEVALYVTYTLNGVEANGDIATFLTEHAAVLDMSDPTVKFDDYFDPTPIINAIRGKTLLEEATVTLTLTADQAKEFGYETELSLTATVTVADIIIYPVELTDEDINLYTGGAYKTAEAFIEYLTDYYKVSTSYTKLSEIAEFNEIPTDVYDALYKGYYDNYVDNMISNPDSMTDAEKTAADKYADENATAEWKDRMLIAYLEKTLNFTFTDANYEAELKELYEYYAVNQPSTLLYYGITTKEELATFFDTYYGEGYLRYQFSNEMLLELVAKNVTYVD